MLERGRKKLIKKTVLATILLGLCFYYVPILTGFFLVCGLVDFSRNKGNRSLAFQRYFFGNGILTWLLSPINLLLDLASHRNPGIWTLEDFPADYRSEITDVLDVFRNDGAAIMADIDAVYGDNPRGMYVYRWYGKKLNEERADLNKNFKYIKTIAVSVFEGKKSTKWHYGPLRMSIRILFNLKPADTDKVFIECQGEKHYWRDDPLYIFDDTLFHRSINDHDARRYVLFMDIARPSPVPAVIDALLGIVSFFFEKQKSLFYKNWTMLKGKKQS